MLKHTVLFSAVFTAVLMLHPAFLSGQTPDRRRLDSIFSEMDSAFNGEQPLSLQEEYYLGRAVAANILAVYMPYTADARLTGYLNLICQALAVNYPQVAVYNGWRVTVLDGGGINAFATPGGHIFITLALVKAAAGEDALAAIIAHEMAHVILKHGVKTIDGMRITSIADEAARRAAAFAGGSGADAPAFRDAVEGVLYTMIHSGYSQPQEFEADGEAVLMLAAAGYSPRGLTEMLEALKAAGGGQSGGINGTHPPPELRIANVERAVSLYREADTRRFREERFRKIMDALFADKPRAGERLLAHEQKPLAHEQKPLAHALKPLAHEQKYLAHEQKPLAHELKHILAVK
jgi:predicted Zn-dependent protease